MEITGIHKATVDRLKALRPYVAEWHELQGQYKLLEELIITQSVLGVEKEQLAPPSSTSDSKKPPKNESKFDPPPDADHVKSWILETFQPLDIVAGKDICREYNISTKTANRMLHILKDMRVLEKVNATRFSQYRVKPNRNGSIRLHVGEGEIK